MLESFSEVFLPYLLSQKADGRFEVLNREYHPLGAYGSETPGVPVKIRGLTTLKLSQMSCGERNPGRPEFVWLYNDGNNPKDSRANLSAYLKRLSVIAQLKVTR